MKKYAKILDNKTKLCQVGLGTNTEFYIKLGMTLLDVTQAYNGNWYITGFEPQKPEKEIIQEQINEYQNLLNSTDWYTIRSLETGIEIPSDILQERVFYRKEISRLRELLENNLEK